MTPYLPRCRSLLPVLALCLGVVLAAGCNPSALFGRPQTYEGLADRVVDSLSHERYDLLRDLVITNEDLRRMGETADGWSDQPNPAAEEAVRESYEQIIQKGRDAGVIWSDVRLSSASAPSARNKYKERVDVKVTLDSRGNRYDLVIRHVQMVDDGDVVLTDRLQWVGEH